MTAKRLLSLLLAVLMVMSTVSVLVSCNPGEGEVTTTPGGDVTTPDAGVQEDKDITLFENGEWTFQIVRNTKLTTLEESASISFRSALTGTVSGATRIAFGRDDLKEGESYDSETLEIYFGCTKHPEMQAFYPTVGMGEAGVKVVGNKILVYSNSYEGYDRLAARFERLCTQNLADNKIVVKASELEGTDVVNNALNAVPVPVGVKLTHSENCEYNQTLLIYDHATPEIFKEYQKKFSGFKENQNIEASGNLFATYTNGEDLYNISYSKGDEKLRVIVNKGTQATDLFEKPASVENKMTPRIILHGLATPGVNADQNGLCMIIQLSDGRYIVVDGGFSKESDSDKLYNLLKKNAPAGTKPTVAAWIITHAHGDHHGTYANYFVKTYSTVVDIQKLIFNPPSAAINKSDNEGGGYTKVISVTAGIKGCEWIRPHVGDRYYIGDAVLDVLYTVDHMYPQSFTYYNTCSLIISLQIAGQRLMITGDAANVSFGKAVKMFGADLKADMVQVAHHGYTTGVSDEAATSITEAYKYMSPSLVLWPIGSFGYESVRNRVYNVILANLPSVKKIIVAKESDHYVDLPFKPE